MKDLYKMLVYFLGEPPKTITWEYYSKKKEKSKYNIIKDVSPLDFYKKHIPFNINDMVCLVNAHSKSKPLNNLYNIQYLGNVIEGVETNFINIQIKDMINIAKKSLDNNKAIWFGCDVDKYIDNDNGLLDIENYDNTLNKYILYKAFILSDNF